MSHAESIEATDLEDEHRCLLNASWCLEPSVTCVSMYSAVCSLLKARLLPQRANKLEFDNQSGLRDGSCYLLVNGTSGVVQ